MDSAWDCQSYDVVGASEVALFYLETPSFTLLRKLGDNILGAKLPGLKFSWLKPCADITAINDSRAPSSTPWASRHCWRACSINELFGLEFI